MTDQQGLSASELVRPEQRTDAFLPIYLESLMLDTILDFDLFIRLDAGMVLYRSMNLPFTEKSRQKLIENNISRLYVPFDARGKYQRYVETNLGSILKDPDIKEERKAGIIYDAAKALVKDVLANPTLGDNIKRTKDLVANQVSFILKGREAFLNLMKITSYDYYTYTHSVNVCTFTIALAVELGISDMRSLHDLGIGALLHDVGKSKISERILNKRSRLNRAEIDIVRKHPKWGKEILEENELIGKESLYPVMQHHERMDGSGYPLGLPANEIHPYGRIITVADVFDALTTRRAYQDAIDTFPALKIMFNSKQHFDERILMEFAILMGPRSTPR